MGFVMLSSWVNIKRPQRNLMISFEDEIQRIQHEFKTKLAHISTHEELEALRIHFLGRNGLISELTNQFKALSAEQKRTLGPLLNELKDSTQESFNQKKIFIENEALLQIIKRDENFDVTAYTPHSVVGSLHPLSHTMHQFEDIFTSMGYQIADGPEVETEYYNFEALNIPENHPARDKFDTFYINIPGLLMRTHTSTIQVRIMEQQTLPIAILAPGRCYRNEATDASHDFMFSQIEGLVIDTDISLSHLLGTLKEFLKAFFEKDSIDIRVRPSYFPFVEPGLEVDMSCPFCTEGCSTCKFTRWIEMGGAGLVHPHVLQASGIDSTVYTGFAFGFGLTRLTMLKYGINDIRLLHSPQIAFLKQF